MRYLDAARVAEVLSPAAAHDEIRRALSLWDTDAIAAPARVRGFARDRGLHLLGGIVADEEDGMWAGMKMYTADAGVGRGHTVLVSSPEGVLTALDATELGALRTGAISGVATEIMHGPARRIAIIGSGYQAEYQVTALRVKNPDADIRIWGRTRERAERLADRLRERGDAEVEVAATIDETTAGADVITVLTRAAKPILGLSQVSPGAHVNAAGSNSLDRREISADLVESSRVAVDSLAQAQLECGDLVPSLEAGRLQWSDVAELGALARRPEPSGGRRTLFESQGIGALDIALAALVVRRTTP